MGALRRAIDHFVAKSQERLEAGVHIFRALQWLTVFTFISGYSKVLNNLEVLEFSKPVSIRLNKDTPAYLAFELLAGTSRYDEVEDLGSTEHLCAEGCRTLDLNEFASFGQTKFDEIRPEAPAFELQAIVIERPPHNRWAQKSRVARSTKPSSSPYKLPQKPLWQLAANQPVRAFDGNSGDASSLRQEMIEDEALAEEFLVDKVLGRKEDAASGLTLRGQISLSKGLALTNEMTFSIQRKENGEAKEQGEIHFRDGKYEITVNDFSGTLVAQLRDKEGAVIGKGIQRLVQGERADNKSLQGPEIIVAPASSSISTGAQSYYDPPASTIASVGPSPRSQEPRAKKIQGLSSNLASGYAQLQVNHNGSELPNINENSFALLRAQAPDFYQTNQIVSNERMNNFFLYPVGMMRALREIVSRQRSSDPVIAGLAKSRDEEVSVIWGQVVQEGRPQEGVEVQFESDEQIRPIYFNEFQIPDPKLQATSKNGLFAFLGSPEGLHSLVARRGLQYVSHANVFVEHGAVATANLETTTHLSPIEIRSYDAFTGAPRPVAVQIQSLDFSIELPEGHDILKLPQIQRLSFAQAQGDDFYAPALFVYNDLQEALNFPAISYQWINSIAEKIQKKTGQSIHSQMGTLVGFVPQEEFIVQAWGGTKPETVQIFYFDQKGELLEQPTGIAGGGFIIFNIVDEYKQVSIDLIQSQTTSLRIFPIDQGKVTVHPLF